MKHGLIALLALALISGQGAGNGKARASDMIQGHEHFIEANGVRLRIWEKLAGDAGQKPIVVLAHGSATAGEESFDLQLPGRPAAGEAAYSLMDFLAIEGFDVFAPDIRGFGRSTKPDTGVTTEEAQTDLDAVIDHVLKIRGAGKVNLVAWSWGTQYAGLETIAHPEKIARYVSFAQMHKDSPDVVKRRERLEDFRKSAYMEIPEAGWKTRFTSMTPERVNDAAAIDAFARAAFAIEKKTPTGPQIDMTTRLPLVDPARIGVADPPRPRRIRRRRRYRRTASVFRWASKPGEELRHRPGCRSHGAVPSRARPPPARHRRVPEALSTPPLRHADAGEGHPLAPFRQTRYPFQGTAGPGRRGPKDAKKPPGGR